MSQKYFVLFSIILSNALCYRQLVVNTLGINLWGDWEMKPEVKRERGEEPKFVVGGERSGRSERGERGGMDLDKLSEMERRMGLGGQEARGGRARDGWR